jgi:hypothetical protein
MDSVSSPDLLVELVAGCARIGKLALQVLNLVDER